MLTSSSTSKRKKNLEFATFQYWEDRYASIEGDHNNIFEWLQTFESLRPYLTQYLPSPCRILHLGCGNSLLGEDLWLNNFGDVINIDYSPSVIDTMKKRIEKGKKVASTSFALEYLLMDATKMNFPSESFDAILDKSTIDSLACNSEEEASKTILESIRVLRRNGVFILITYGAPEVRLCLGGLSNTKVPSSLGFWLRLDYQTQLQGLGDDKGPGNFQYFYVFRKTPI
jgi:ubiquinone/menaquinone biosynthesis C-methylase UbiE